MMRRGALAITAAALMAVIGMSGCGGTDRPVPTTPRVTVPTTTGPALTATAFRTTVNNACTALYARVGALGNPPTDSVAEARVWYPKAAAAWHAHLDRVDALVPPADLAVQWAKVVDDYRLITQAADDNVALANSDREAIELINSDPTAEQTRIGAEIIDRLRALGLTGCTGGS
ncbi:MAG: hypothetical protein WCK40_07260 [Thermoleophilia bacterium]